MKTLKLILIGIIFFISTIVNAQVSVNVTIGSPPMWGPIGYTEVRYYYLPDIEAYYDIQTSMFIYFGNGVWMHRTYLPSYYGNYDLYSGYKVVMTNYYGNTPYVHFDDYKRKYAKGYHGRAQKTIGARPNGRSQTPSNDRVRQVNSPSPRQSNEKRNSNNNGGAVQKNPGNPGNTNHGNDRGKGNGGGKRHK